MKVVVCLKETHDKLLTEVFIKSKADTGHQALLAQQVATTESLLL